MKRRQNTVKCFASMFVAVPTLLGAQSTASLAFAQNDDVVFMSSPSFRAPDKIIYEYRKEQKIFPRRVVLELHAGLLDQENGRWSKIPSRFHVIGCGGPAIDLRANSFAEFQGVFKGFSIVATNDGENKCNTRNLSIVFETTYRDNDGDNIQFYYGIIVLPNGTIGFRVDQRRLQAANVQ